MIKLMGILIRIILYVCVFSIIGMLLIVLSLILWDSKFMEYGEIIINRIWTDVSND